MKLGLPRYLTLGLLLAAGAALALAVGYWNISPGSFAPATVERDNARPDFYIDNARIQMLDEQGKVAYRLTAEHAVHQIEDGRPALSSPSCCSSAAKTQRPGCSKRIRGW